MADAAKPLEAKSNPSLGKFSWEDPFLLEEQLNEDERMIRDSANAFAQNELLPRVSEAYLNETSAPELFPMMGDMGLLGVTVATRQVSTVLITTITILRSGMTL